MSSLLVLSLLFLGSFVFALLEPGRTDRELSGFAVMLYLLLVTSLPIPRLGDS